jgi:hypothetical protein
VVQAVTFTIQRQRSRFARGPVANAITKVADHRPVAYADEDAALMRVAQEIAMLAERYRVPVTTEDASRWARRNADGSASILADPVGVVYRITKDNS